MNEQTQAEPAQAEAEPAQAPEAPEIPVDDVPLEIRVAAAAGLLGAAHKVCNDVLIGLVEPDDALEIVRGHLFLTLQQLSAIDGMEWEAAEEDTAEEEVPQ
jgi:hypothetical protein